MSEPSGEKNPLDDLEPGDRDEEFNPFDWCLAAGCGCGGCLDPTGCLDAMSQGCLGCLDSCLTRLGCGTIVLAVLIGIGKLIF
ncbi:MAG TPA: hypothetical protein VGB30_14670 [bacterium]